MNQFFIAPGAEWVGVNTINGVSCNGWQTEIFGVVTFTIWTAVSGAQVRLAVHCTSDAHITEPCRGERHGLEWPVHRHHTHLVQQRSADHLRFLDLCDSQLMRERLYALTISPPPASHQLQAPHPRLLSRAARAPTAPLLAAAV